MIRNQLIKEININDMLYSQGETREEQMLRMRHQRINQRRRTQLIWVAQLKETTQLNMYSGDVWHKRVANFHYLSTYKHTHTYTCI